MLPIRRFLSLLPTRLASSLCYRLFARRSAEYPAYFEAAPLRFAPETRMRLRAGDWAHVSIAFMGVYELPLTRLVVSVARRSPGGMMIDVGANYGYFSLLWASLHPRNRAIAFEPAPANAAALSANVVDNGFKSRIEVIPAAVGRERGEVRFTQDIEQSGWSRISDNGTSGQALPLVTLDDSVPASHGPIGLLKIDTEGHDWAVLEGSRRLFASRRVEVAVFECDAAEYNGPQGAHLQTIAREHGYRIGVLEENTEGLMTCLLTRDDIPAA